MASVAIEGITKVDYEAFDAQLVSDFFGPRARSLRRDSAARQVSCVLYDAFVFACGLEGESLSFEAAMLLGPGFAIDTFLWQEVSAENTTRAIQETLAVVDADCRLRLPDKYLKAFAEAYPAP